VAVFFTYFSVKIDFDLIKQHAFHLDTIINALKKD